MTYKYDFMELSNIRIREIFKSKGYEITHIQKNIEHNFMVFSLNNKTGRDFHYKMRDADDCNLNTFLRWLAEEIKLRKLMGIY